SFAAPATINLGANASDPDGTIAKVEFYAGTMLVGTAISPPYTVAWTNAPAGDHTLTAKAIDNSGLSATSNPVTISLNAITLSVASPTNGDTTFDTSVVVTGTVGGAAPTSITVNGQTAVLTGSSFAVAVPLQLGNNTLVVT